MIQFIDGEPVHVGDNAPIRPATTLRDMLAAVAAENNVTVEALRGPRRDGQFPRLRAVFCRRAMDEGRYSTTQIGRAICRDHSTVIYALGRLRRKPSYFSPSLTDSSTARAAE